MPFLIVTAYLHSIMVQERRGMLKVWNVSLICGAFVLALLGTFLVRSGILQSIHAFGASTVGGPLLGLIAVVAIGSTALIVSRLDELKPERRIGAPLSREGVFLVNNLLLVGLAAVIFWGTFFPLIAEAFTGTRSSLGAPWFDRYVTPIGVLLVLFTGIGPLLAWGRLSAGAARRLLLWPGRSPPAAAVVLVARHRRRRQPLGAVPVRLRGLHAGRAGAGVLAGGGSRAARSPASRSPGRCRGRSRATAAATAATSSTSGSRSC